MPDSITTDRLVISPATEADRDQLTALFADKAFMEYSGGLLDSDGANARFDRMVARVGEIPFAKQPIRVIGTEEIIGYAGFDRASFEGVDRLEMGWRLVETARGQGYATEAAQAMLVVADSTPPLSDHDRTALAIIDPRNTPSANVARKLGFLWWRRAEINGFVDDLYTRPLGASSTE